MARVNIYLPDDLKAKMAKRPDVNWSAEFQKLVYTLTLRDWLIVSTTDER